jgi:hypothetical protein
MVSHRTPVSSAIGRWIIVWAMAWLSSILICLFADLRNINFSIEIKMFKLFITQFSPASC